MISELLRVNKSELSVEDLNGVLQSIVYAMWSAQTYIDHGDMVAAMSYMRYKVLVPMEELCITPKEVQDYYNANIESL